MISLTAYQPCILRAGLFLLHNAKRGSRGRNGYGIMYENDICSLHPITRCDILITMKPVNTQKLVMEDAL